MKALFFLRAANFDRLFEAALDELLARGHEVHVAFDVEKKKNRFGDSVVFDRLAERHGRLTYGPAPAEANPRLGELGRQLRLGIDYLRYLTPEYRNATKLRERAQRRAHPWLVRAVSAPAVRSDRGRAALDRLLRRLEAILPLDDATRQFIATRAPDVVLVSPLVGLGSTQGRYIRAAKALGIPTAVPVASWDNLTNKGVILDAPDLLLVWNPAQVEEAVALHGLARDRVEATGAHPYDHWFSQRPSTTCSEFCERVGLPSDAPFVLYACSSRFIAPDEPDFVAEWLSRLRRSEDPRLRGLNVLVRPHPANAQVWRDADLADPGVAVWPAAGEVPRGEQSRADYFDSIFHSRAVVAVNTSAIVETAIIGRPVLTVRARYRATQEGTLHFAHISAEHGGPLLGADTFEEHLSLLASAVAGSSPPSFDDFLHAFIRPHGLDEPARPRLAAAIERLTNDTRRRPAPSKRARILMLLDHPGLLMHFDEVVGELRRRGHDVRLLFGRPRRFEEALEAVDGIRSEPAPALRRSDGYAAVARRLRAALDLLPYLEPGLADASAARRKWGTGPDVPWWLRSASPWLRRSPIARGVLRSILRGLEQQIPADAAIVSELAAQRPDLLIVSPLVQRDAYQADWIKAARALGVPSVLCVASWDNLTSKGTVRVMPDRVTVWNETQRAEALELHRMPARQIDVTGAQPFDRWFDRTPSLDRTVFCRSVGLGDDRPYLLWVGSTRQGMDPRAEPALVRDWVHALRASGNRELGGIAVLVRPHPTTLETWRDIEIDGATIWRRDEPLPVRGSARSAYFDGLHHAAALVGINSSAMLEAAIVGIPVHTIELNEWRPMQRDLRHFGYLLLENGGFVRSASSLERHVTLLAEDLRSEAAWRPAQEAFVRRFVRPHERPATEVLIESLERTTELAVAPWRPSAGRIRRAGLLVVSALRSSRSKLSRRLSRSQALRPVAATVRLPRESWRRRREKVLV